MPKLQVYAEIGLDDGGCLLFTFDPPGLLARGRSFDEAMEVGRSEVRALRRFLAQGGCLGLLQEAWGEGQSPEIVVAETVRRRGRVGNGGTRATFKRDFVPVRPEDTPGLLGLMRHMRATLWTLKDRIPPEAYAFRSLPRRGAIGEQLAHIAACDRWYLSCFWDDLPRLRRSRDVWDKLVLNRDLALEKLGNLVPEECGAARKAGQQTWTPRKLFRRFLYHERFHRDTVERDLALFLAGGENRRELTFPPNPSAAR